MRHPLAPIFLTLVLAAGRAQTNGDKPGHSHLGTAFDEGPRQKPWTIAGIGEAHLPISTKNPEVQLWFDRGVALLHSFWYYEAERAFRWCNKLEPENAMVYWGLARSAMDSERAQEFLREAEKRKNAVTERERLYIEALSAGEMPDPYQDRPADRKRSSRESRNILEKLCVKYPDDMEARAFLVEMSKRGYRSEEPNECQREGSAVLPRLLAYLYTNEKVTRGAIAEQISVPLSELEALMFGLAMSRIEGANKGSSGSRADLIRLK